MTEYCALYPQQPTEGRRDRLLGLGAARTNRVRPKEQPVRVPLGAALTAASRLFPLRLRQDGDDAAGRTGRARGSLRDGRRAPAGTGAGGSGGEQKPSDGGKLLPFGGEPLQRGVPALLRPPRGGSPRRTRGRGGRRSFVFRRPRRRTRPDREEQGDRARPPTCTRGLPAGVCGVPGWAREPAGHYLSS